ncbi:hypothetical protein G9A89_016487 [Geosiphon pyriformis]|nr:hypothetical protein G9A89_016487 [Geosiphon pyriformis]
MGNDRKRSIIFTGHRFAGVYAIFTALQIKRKKWSRKVFAYTWGTPRFGEINFSRHVDNILFAYRFTLLDDQYPREPSHHLGYNHHQIEYWIKSECDCDKHDVYQCLALPYNPNYYENSSFTAQIIHIMVLILEYILDKNVRNFKYQCEWEGFIYFKVK